MRYGQKILPSAHPDCRHDSVCERRSSCMYYNALPTLWPPRPTCKPWKPGWFTLTVIANSNHPDQLVLSLSELWLHPKIEVDLTFLSLTFLISFRGSLVGRILIAVSLNNVCFSLGRGLIVPSVSYSTPLELISCLLVSKEPARRLFDQCVFGGHQCLLQCVAVYMAQVHLEAACCHGFAFLVGECRLGCTNRGFKELFGFWGESLIMKATRMNSSLKDVGKWRL